MGPLKFPLAAFFSILFVTPLFSQAEIENDYGSWFVINGNNSLLEKWGIPTVGILRHHGMLEDYEFGFFRTGINYKKSEKIQFGIGGAFLSSKFYLPEEHFETGHQYWFYQESTLKTKLYRTTIAQRLRLENRWIHRNEEVHFNMRLRYRLQVVQNLNEKIYLKVFDEFFVNLNDSFFNQNRLYIGIGHRVSKNINVDIGYLKNHFTSTQNDVIRMGINFKTNLLSSKRSSAKIDSPLNISSSD